jgi:glutamine cyclotransferase
VPDTIFSFYHFHFTLELMIRLQGFLSLSLILFACTSKEKKEDTHSSKDLIPYKVTGIFPHDATAFTQGLVIENGRLFESTGQSNSWIAEVAITTGKQDKKVTLDPKYFGEGITILNNKIYQLTWQSKIGFIYDLKTFEKKGEFTYEHEGWGITHNGKNLIVSDGTDKLRFLDTLTLKELSSVLVKDHDVKRDSLNELEFIDGFVFANLWLTNTIVKIDPSTGKVVGKLDLSKIGEEVRLKSPQADVLNGIAYEKKSKTLLITGKQWPACYAIRFMEPANSQATK